MKPQRMAAAALSFAHLIGLKRAEEDEDKKARRAEEERDDDEEQDKKDAKADEEEGDGDENMQSNRAEEGDEEEGDGDEKDGKKSRKAKSKSEEPDEEDADEEDGDDNKKSKASAVRLAVRRERARCAQIIAHGIATGRVRQAGVLAFDSELSVKAAKTMLDAGDADSPMIKAESVFAGSLSQRMASANIQHVGADAGGNAPAGMTKVAAAIIAAGEKARGETAKK